MPLNLTYEKARGLRLTRILPMAQIDPAGIRYWVNEMRSHFKPCEDQTTLKIRAEGSFLRLVMELPDGEPEAAQ